LSLRPANNLAAEHLERVHGFPASKVGDSWHSEKKIPVTDQRGEGGTILGVLCVKIALLVEATS
jgi:hypothetical protein